MSIRVKWALPTVGLAILALVGVVMGAGHLEAAPMSIGKTVNLQRNSVNGLAAAIEAAGPGGTVIVHAGAHFEATGVLITSPVTILGKRGAVLYSVTAPALSYPLDIDAALHVRGTSGVSIRGLEMRPAEGAVGGTAILIDNASNVEVSGNRIDGYQFGVLNELGDRAEIRGNTIHVTDAWQTGAVPEAHGIVNINGVNARIEDNVVSGALFGIWACHLNGRVAGNSISASFIGVILCNVPQGSFLISGQAVGSLAPASGWTMHGNFASGNQWGYLVIDGANANTITNNAASGSGVYDMELTADTYRFGFLTPASFNNTVDVGPHAGLVIKDCGINNTITGGIRVDTSLDPCF